MGAEQQGGAGLGAGPQGLRHQVDAMHAVVAVFVIDLQGFAVIAHAVGGAQVRDIGFDIQFGVRGGAASGFQFASGIGGHCGLVDADVVFPNADDAHISPGH